MMTSVMTASGGFCGNCARAAAASAHAIMLMLSRRKAILMTSRMVALSSMKYTVGVRFAGASARGGMGWGGEGAGGGWSLLRLWRFFIRHVASAFVEFAHGIEHEIRGIAQHGVLRRSAPIDKLVNAGPASVNRLDDVHDGFVAEQA